MKKLFIVLGVLVMVVITIAFSHSSGKVYAEYYWTRYESSDPNFLISGGWEVETYAPYSGGSTRYTNVPGATITFNFTGTEFRIISDMSPQRSQTNNVNIDGISYNFSEYRTNGDHFQSEPFESLQHVTLADGVHHVIITAIDDHTVVDIDAIEILGTLTSPTITPTPIPTLTPTPTSPTSTPTTSPKLCYGNSIVGSLGTYNPGTIYQNSNVMNTYTISGVELGDFVQVSFDKDLQGIILYGYVSAVNQVTVVFQNSTYSTITLTSGTVRIHVTGHTSP